MTITADSILTIGSIIGVLALVGGYIVTLVKWVIRQGEQDKEISNIKSEQRIVLQGVLACLDGLGQMGCNHSVPKAKADIEAYLNEAAHR